MTCVNEKIFEKINNKGHTCNKAYLLRFIDNMRLRNASVDSHVKILSNKINSQKLKHCFRFINCKKCKQCKDDEVEWYEKRRKM